MEKITLFPYPYTQKTEVIDDFFGTSVIDPYRWLEDDTSDKTKNG